MYGKLQQRQYLWDLIMMKSLSEIEVFLDRLSFDYKQQLDNGLLYSSLGEALIVEILNDKPRMITYKTDSEPDYNDVINYAKQGLQYKTRIDDRIGNEHVIRLDGEVLVLFCRAVNPSQTIGYSLRLLSKASLTTTAIQPAVIILSV